MDLTVSPDLEAYWCYAIVVVLGAWVGARQVNKRLGGIRGIWLQIRTWVLFLAYLAVPVGLFWLLDRTGAIADTSFFSAVLIGVGYERIITGQSDTVRTPEEVSRFWTPFLAYADSVERSARQRTARDQSRLDERVIAKIANDPAIYDRFLELSRLRAADLPALDAQLASIDQVGAGQGEVYARERKTRFLYGLLIALPDGYRLLLDRNIVDRPFYYFYVCGIGLALRPMLAALLILVVAGLALWRYAPDYHQGLERYYAWRIGKLGSTDQDQFRARRSMVALMQANNGVRSQAVYDLTQLLRRPNMPMERVDLILQTLLEASDQDKPDTSLAVWLAPSLRAISVDARSRVHDVLKFLASKCTTQPAPELQQWRPADGDSTSDLERRVTDWRLYWTTSACS
jgi:hypothetical protein